MISKQTIFSLLLALLLAAGMRAWSWEHVDDCDRFHADKSGTPVSIQVKSGTRIVSVPCSVWVVRQPVWMQGCCLLLGALVVVFVFSVWSDWSRARERRRKGYL